MPTRTEVGRRPIRIVSVIFVAISTVIFAVSIWAYLYIQLHGIYYASVLYSQIPTLIGLPMAASAALLLVLLLPENYGNIDARVLGIHLRGASGPIILWVICFLSIAATIKLTWIQTPWCSENEGEAAAAVQAGGPHGDIPVAPYRVGGLHRRSASSQHPSLP
jgi:hypothetical protein